jgi:hypothetical protein
MTSGQFPLMPEWRARSFSGNLSVTFDSGLIVTIPNHQLVVPDYYVEGNATIFSDDTREIRPILPTLDSHSSRLHI